MRSRIGYVILLLTVAGCQPVDNGGVGSRDEQSRSKLEGVWRLVRIQYVDSTGVATEGTPQESQIQFSGAHYYMGYSHHERPSPSFASPWEPTPQELMARYGGLVTNAGTFEVSDTSLILRPTFALWPSVRGSETISAFQFSGDTLVVTYLDQISADAVSDPYYAGGARYVLHMVRMD